MNRNRTATVVTVLLLAGLIAAAVLRKGRTPAPPPAPQDAIYNMLDAARAGDSEAYLRQYAGPMEAQLKQTSGADLRTYLRTSSAEIKGVAVSQPQMLTDRQAELRVEYIYQDRNETQRVYLEKFGAAWKITRVDSAERTKTLVPYGSPVE